MADSRCLRHGTSLAGAKTHPYAWAWAQKGSRRNSDKHLQDTSQTSGCCDASFAGYWCCQQQQQQLKQAHAAAAGQLIPATAAGTEAAVKQLQQYQQSWWCCPHVQGAAAAPVQQQVPKHAAYLETALQLANNSLAASMYYLNSAYLLSDDPAAASAALDVAELHLAHTLRRTKMAVRMAAAIKSAEQQQHGQLFAACLQQQQLVQLQAQYMQTEDGEEVSSRWHPSTPQAACMQ